MKIIIRKKKPTKTPKKTPKIVPDFDVDAFVDKVIEDCIIEYGTYVNEQRHIPDYRDGLKPVQRRVLWTMMEDGVRWDSRFTKCAAIVGNTLSRYHPHGDEACYGALVGMTGEPTKGNKNIFFGPNWQYPLIEGYGNFGSIDGDKAAAMRYPESRLSKLSQFLFNLKPCIQTIPNYLNNRQEPLFLPASFPYLLLNGVSGIAVGVSTDIMPHNLSEVCDILILCLRKKTVPTVKQLMRIMKGPDWTYGGIIWDEKEVEQVYTAGRGVINWGLSTEVSQRGRTWIVKIVGIPPRFNLKRYLEKLRDKKEVKKIRKLDISSKIEIEVEASTEKMMEEIVSYKYAVKNDWNITSRNSEEDIEFQHTDLRSYLTMWLDYCVKTHKQYFKLEIERLNGEIRADQLRILAFKNINKVIALIKAENDKGLMRLLKCTLEEVDMIKKILLGSLAKTNEAAIRKRILVKKKDKRIMIGYFRKTEAYLVNFFKSLKKFSRERQTSFID